MANKPHARKHLLPILSILISATALLLTATSLERHGLDRSESFKTNFIRGKSVTLDQKVFKTHGSYYKGVLYDPETVEMVYAELEKVLENKNEVILWDIGANTGSFALLPVMTNKIKVFAFEPNLEVADILRLNVNLNKITDNVTVLPIGISNKTEIIKLNIPSGTDTGIATFASQVLRFDQQTASSFSALTMPIDVLASSLLNKGERIDVLKIDTEGWEYYVLLGALKTLQQQRPILLLEFHETNMSQASVNPQELLGLLKKLNYDCKMLVEDLLCHPLR